MPRTAKSAMLHIMEGNPNNKTKKELQKRQKNELKMKLSADNLVPPKWLNESAAKRFTEITQIMAPTGILSDSDVDTLAIYCDTLADYKSHKNKVKQLGMFKDGKVNPFVREKRNTAILLNRYANELGLTPSARASMAIHMSDDEDGDEDDF
ncbi:phage terminase small subunit P27 family [Latilactobacillus curvatus]|uniref:phage terminase small subunit P27 family n=1 Tax=Latilactobacillus curvatus TaxID=28038 RepID=UPI0020C7B1E1|nr:phage terminase small subunit P27 family [Latilactobacillus curvatus]MCP8859448.1 phage terminase small subunit P27 family [Latilactobacillus curvatus]